MSLGQWERDTSSPTRPPTPVTVKTSRVESRLPGPPRHVNIVRYITLRIVSFLQRQSDVHDRKSNSVSLDAAHSFLRCR